MKMILELDCSVHKFGVTVKLFVTNLQHIVNEYLNATMNYMAADSELNTSKIICLEGFT